MKGKKIIKELIKKKKNFNLHQKKVMLLKENKKLKNI